MSEFINTQGIVIKQNNVGEADKAITLLTKDCGKIRIWVNGARRPRSRMIGCSQLFCVSDFALYAGRETYRINSADIVEPFYGLREDLQKLSYAAYIVELVNDGIPEGDVSSCIPDLMRLLMNSLYFIDRAVRNPDLIVHIFEMRFMSLIGFDMNFAECCVCHEPLEVNDYFYFDIERDGFVCDKCINGSEMTYIKISSAAYNALYHMMKLTIEKVYSFAVSESVLAELEIFCKAYINKHMDKEYKSLHYYTL